jgi:hypothetical protein
MNLLGVLVKRCKSITEHKIVKTLVGAGLYQPSNQSVSAALSPRGASEIHQGRC